MADAGGGGTGDGDAQSVYVTASDGLKLHVRCFGPGLAPGLPVVCLPGLARTADDLFEIRLAVARFALLEKAA